MRTISRFFSNHKTTLTMSFVLSFVLVMMVGPASAQSLDTSAFQAAITDGIQIFFDNLPAFVLVGFAVFSVIFAFMGGLGFAKSLLMQLMDGLTGK